MQKKSFQKFYVAIFCVSVACSGAKDTYIVSHLKHIQVLEKQDHKFCASLKLDFNKNDNSKSALYWRCRLSLSKYKLYTNNSMPEYVKHNLEISDLVTKISLKISVTPEAIMVRENKKIDNRQHQQCLIMGFEIETEDQAKIDDYFACRKALVEDQSLIPPFGNFDYLAYPNNSYNLGFVIDRRVDEGIARYNSMKEKYPNCIKFNLKNVNFKKCVMAQSKSHQCFSEIEKKKFKKELEEKTTCQKQSYIRFPNEFLKEDERAKAEIRKMNTSSDYYNQQSLSALGMDDSQFDSDEKRVEKEELKKQKMATKNINSKDGLYSKYELTQLRQKYIFGCQKEVDGRILQYVNDLKKTCEEMVKFEIVGEE